MNQQGNQDWLNGKFKLGAEVVAAGPNGNSYNASAAWQAPILSYSQSKGVYGGANIAGSTISIDNGAMKSVFGSNVKAQTVLSGSVQPPPQAQPFISALPPRG